jgi:salicylate hydroxylase
MAAHAPILIAGGGIGGLALALALAQAGRATLVLERQTGPAPAGAGIQIGPNGVRVLRRLGVADALEPLAGKPEAIEVFDGASARRLARLPLGGWIAARHGAPYWVAHRGDLARVLLEAAARSPLIEVRGGFEVAAVAQEGSAVTVASAAGERLSGPALIGADGLWSAVRRALSPQAAPRFAGATATRTVLPADRAQALAAPAVGLWLSPTAHVVHYPVRGGREIAVVAIVKEAWDAPGWDAAADGAALVRRLGAFHARLTEPLRAAAGVPAWRKWALHVLPEPDWTSGRVALLGDAAHPMLPYLAQGGACAMEDAVVLADCLCAHGEDVAAALGRYRALRVGRCRRVQRASVRQGRIYRLGAPWSWARDAVFRSVPAPWLMARLDWLYGWCPPA